VRKRADGADCSAANNCRSNVCTRNRCVCITCPTCNQDSNCANGRYCDTSTRPGRCLEGRPVTGVCDRHRMCASGVCTRFVYGTTAYCRECGATASGTGLDVNRQSNAIADATCKTRYGNGFCEMNQFNMSYFTFVCRGCLSKDTFVDRASACCSGQTYRSGSSTRCT
jgi:hypothetical protein